MQSWFSLGRWVVLSKHQVGGFERLGTGIVYTWHLLARSFSTVIQDEVNLVTALVPSDTACLASSPGSINRTAVWTSREDKVAFLL